VSRLALAASTVLPLVLALARMHGLLRRLEHQAGHDHLTGLLSRAEFTRRAEHDLAAGRVRAVLVIDVDGFKRVNDTFGHSAGDAVLVAVAGRLTAWAPDGSVLGRLGGDEFAVVLPHRLARFGPGGDVDPHVLAPFLEVQVVAPSGTGGLGPDESGADAPGPGAGGWWVTVSVGVADLGADQGAADRAGRAEWTLDAVLAEADGQMYRQKAGSRSRRLADPPAVRTGADDPSAGVRS
jgi:GGDEF domain-containing protein